MKKIFHLIILIICLQVNAQENPQAITITGFGKFDTLRPFGKNVIDAKKLTKKLLSQEVNLTQPVDVLIEMNGFVTVKVWNESKVKIETSVSIEGPSDLTDEKWLDIIGISNKLTGNTVKVMIGQPDKYNFTSSLSYSMPFSDRTRGASEAVYKGDGSYLGSLMGKREVTLYIPSTSKLEIQNKYGLLTLVNNIKDISIVNTNGEINAQDIDHLELHSSSGRFIAGVIRNGDLNISHGRLYLTELTKGVLTTSYNTIEIQKAGVVELNSASDDIDINESGSISGIKNYGSLLINLSGKLDLAGMNSRIKIRNIAPSTDLIRIFDMNTDLRIPLHEPQKYAINVKGNFINLYSNFSDKMTTDTLTSSEAAEIKSRRDSLIALAKIMGSRNAQTAGGGTIGTRPQRPPRDIYTAGSTVRVISDTLVTPEKAFSTRDSLIKTGTTINLKSNYINTNPSISVQSAQTKEGTTITITDSFTTPKNYKYTFNTGDGAAQTRFDIICINCTIDFK